MPKNTTPRAHNTEAPRVLRAIVRELDGKEWNGDTLDAIVGHLRAAGYQIRDVEEASATVGATVWPDRTTAGADWHTCGNCGGRFKPGTTCPHRQTPWSTESYDARQARLDAAFAKVRPADHWKNPIRATLPKGTTPEQLDEIREAVIHFTGSVPEFEPLADGRVRVEAAGYFATIGA
jgi:hypothetical protein